MQLLCAQPCCCNAADGQSCIHVRAKHDSNVVIMKTKREFILFGRLLGLMAWEAEVNRRHGVACIIPSIYRGCSLARPPRSTDTIVPHTAKQQYQMQTAKRVPATQLVSVELCCCCLWLNVWLVDWLIDRLNDWLFHWLIVRLIGWLTDWLIDSSIDRLILLTGVFQDKVITETDMMGLKHTRNWTFQFYVQT